MVKAAVYTILHPKIKGENQTRMQKRSPTVPTLYTIGFQRKPLSQFIALLRQAGVDAIIDIRLRNTSQLSGYTKRDDLAFLLNKGFDIAYEHRPDLAPSGDILDAYREDKDWAAYS